MSVVNKVLIFCCCSNAACFAGSASDAWQATQSCFLGYLNCFGGWWGLCAPICHELGGPNTGQLVQKWTIAIKYFIQAIALNIVAPFDGCINWAFYMMKNCGEGVKGFNDVTENAGFLGKKVRQALGLDEGTQPRKTFGTYKP